MLRKFHSTILVLGWALALSVPAFGESPEPSPAPNVFPPPINPEGSQKWIEDQDHGWAPLSSIKSRVTGNCGVPDEAQEDVVSACRGINRANPIRIIECVLTATHAQLGGPRNGMWCRHYSQVGVGAFSDLGFTSGITTSSDGTHQWVVVVINKEVWIVDLLNNIYFRRGSTEGVKSASNNFTLQSAWQMDGQAVCLDVDLNNWLDQIARKTKVKMCNGNERQLFIWVEMNSGFGQIRSVGEGGKCLDAHSDASTTYFRDCHNGDNQLWWYDQTTGRLSNKQYSDRCLDVSQSPGSTDSEGGRRVYLYPCHDGDNQKWTTVPQ